MVQIPFDDLFGELPMLVWIAGQGAYLEFAAGLQGAHNSASLLPRSTENGDQLLICGFHIQCLSSAIY